MGNISSGAGSRERIEAARRLRVLVDELVDLVVLGEALSGTSWEDITQALHRRDAATVQAEYEDAVNEWRRVPAEGFEGDDSDARTLDAWCQAHREVTDPSAKNPVSDLLQAD